MLTKRMRVLLADDHTMVAEGLGSLLKEHHELVGTAANGLELVKEAIRLKPDVIVADVSMPVLSGLDAVRRLKREGLDARVIFVTMHADAQLAAEALRVGASGYLLKQSAGEELITAVQEATLGRVYLTPLIAKDLIATLSASGADSAERLTPRQREVLRLIAEGRRMKEIAAVLQLSTRTVETHKYEMMQTLGIQSTAELVRYAIHHGLVDS
jgi:DNA-binding NarL/FixJ family response regulator